MREVGGLQSRHTLDSFECPCARASLLAENACAPPYPHPTPAHTQHLPPALMPRPTRQAALAAGEARRLAGQVDDPVIAIGSSRMLRSSCV